MEDFVHQISNFSNYCQSCQATQTTQYLCLPLLQPPGPIDNRAIIVSSNSGSAEGKQQQQHQQQQQQQHTLRQGSDYLQVSRDIWLLFSSIYGGGPDVVVRPNGTVLISGT